MDYEIAMALRHTEIWVAHSCTIRQKRLLEVSSFGRRRTTSIKTGRLSKLDYGSNACGYKNFGNYFGRAHRCIAQVFIANPKGKPYINHIDGNKTNNNVSNLEWCTQKENTRHAWAIGLCENTRKQTEEHRANVSRAMMDDSIHHFYNYETEQSVFGKYKHLRENSKQLFDLSNSSISSLKLGKLKNCKSWLYLGIAH